MSNEITQPAIDASTEQELTERGSNRSHRPSSAAFKGFISGQWGPRPDGLPSQGASAPYAAARRAELSSHFPGERLVIPCGELKVRNNDCDYRFRPHSAFAHLTGLGTDQEPDAVLVLHPADTGHEAVLYFRPRASRSTEEFYADSRYGELWVGVRPSLAEMEAMTGIRCAHSDELADALAKDAGPGQVALRVVPQADANVEELVAKVRQAAGLAATFTAESPDEKLAETLAEMRICKDEYELEQLRLAVDLSKAGFERMLAELPRAAAHHRGERVLEGAFGAAAREEGNGLGYDTIVAAGDHANTLHWISNDGPVRAGELILIDAGVEADSLYTADITRTVPVSGRFTPAQREVYEAVLAAADASFARASEPGVRFRHLHEAAMEVIAARLEAWGMLPVSAAESLEPEGQYHRRWMVHGTSHHLGLDVHDCAQARREMYLDAELAPGMCFTIEPGLYFRADDLAVPERFRGIGVRIEDNIVINLDGEVERISEHIPRQASDVEAWVQALAGG